MDALLSEIYYNPKKGLSSSPIKLYKLAKKENDKITMKIVKEFIKKQELNQITRQAPKKIVYNTITAQYIRGSCQLDILDMSNYKTKNKQFRYILLLIDVYSRKVFGVALKTRKEPQLSEAYKEIVKQVGGRIYALVSDKEFNSNLIQAFLKEQDTKHFMKDPDNHTSTSVIERYNRTIRGLFRKLFIINGNLNWIDHYQDIIENYNNDYHRTTKATPNDIWSGKEKNKQVRNKPPTLNVGDTVRVQLKKKDIFTKGTVEYSKAIYTITGRDGVGYTVNGKKRFHYQLQVVKSVQNPVKGINDVQAEVVKDNRIDKLLKQDDIDENNVIRQRRGTKEIFDTGYYINRKGEIFNPQGKPVTGWVETSGYHRVKILGKKYYIHRLVAQVFIKNNKNPELTVDHINQRRGDNNVKNLRWINKERQAENRGD